MSAARTAREPRLDEVAAAQRPGEPRLRCYFDQYDEVEISQFPNAKQTCYDLFGGP